MPIKPRNPNNVRSSELGAAHEDHEHAHADLTGVTSDQHHAEAHSVASHNDTTATGAELETLTDGSDADALHDHASAIHDDVAGEIAAITAKTTPVDADVALIEDSAATNAKKKLSWANIKATLKTYFDTLYAVAAEGVTNGDTHDHVGGDGAQIDHGGLAGLTDDDHTQYLNDTRHDTEHATTAVSVTNQTLNNAAVTTIAFDTEDWNDGLTADLVTDHDVTVSDAGIYTVSMRVVFNGNGTGERLFRMLVNGSNLGNQGILRWTPSGTSNEAGTNTATVHVNLSANDALSMTAFQSSGGNLDILLAEMKITRLRGAP